MQAVTPAPLFRVDRATVRRLKLQKLHRDQHVGSRMIVVDGWGCAYAWPLPADGRR